MVNRKFWQGVMIGAAVGGALTLLDRGTREDWCKQGRKVKFAINNPKQASENIKKKTNELRTTYEHVKEDYDYISNKLYELKDVPPRINEMIQETKKVLD